MAKKKVPTLDLPDTLSGLIKVAIKDLKKAEKAKNVVIDMGEWYKNIDYSVGYGEKPRKAELCRVCLAGSVIRSGLTSAGLNKVGRYCPNDFDSDTSNKLSAINRLREGDVIGAARRMNITVPRIVREYDVQIVDYSDDPDEFKIEMMQLASDLEQVGL